MANKLSTIFVLLLIFIIALITYWLKAEVEKELLIKNKNNASGPEFYLKSFNSIQTKKNGDVKFILSAKNMEQFDLIGEDDLFHCIIYEKITIDMEKECIECLINIGYSTFPLENEDIITCDDIQRMVILNNKICPTWFKKVCD